MFNCQWLSRIIESEVAKNVDTLDCLDKLCGYHSSSRSFKRKLVERLMRRPLVGSRAQKTSEFGAHILMSFDDSSMRILSR